MGAMTINQYLNSKGIKANQAARELEVSRQTFWKARNGEISKKIALKVERWSNGDVRAVELIFPSVN
jgi:predicted DNA-binding protein (UPF0251 family)